MLGVNKVTLVGNIGKDPEIKHLDNGRSRASFSLATNESYKNKQGEKVTNTEWHNIVMWYPLADIAEKYLRKGSSVYLEGKIVTRSYEDREGVTKYITEIVARELVMLDSKSSSDNMDSYSSSFGEGSKSEKPQEVDELPF